MKTIDKQYVYIVQASNETARCQIGKTKDLEQQLKTYNSIAGNSKSKKYRYLFTCQVGNMAIMEYDIKEKFSVMSEEGNGEMYFYNSALFEMYVDFIKEHKMFIKEVPIKKSEPKQIVKNITKQTEKTL